DREVLTTDYMQGMAHCPAYKASIRDLGNHGSIGRMDAIQNECQTAKHWKTRQNIPSPTIDEFLYCLVSDSSVLDCGEFKNWASDYGYDPDSRKAEKIYRECLSQAIKLQATIGPDKLSELRELFQDY